MEQDAFSFLRVYDFRGYAETMAYRPKPFATPVQLSQELLALTEQLAENAHETWASLRMADGWTYGPELDFYRKLHHRLVPYDQLPESEKEYDRRMALATLRLIINLGFRIERS
jgi:hypothetical protein